jgi:diguanylate cyclase (GGDEF)-like protein
LNAVTRKLALPEKAGRRWPAFSLEKRHMNAAECLNKILLITDNMHLAALINEQCGRARYTITLCTGGRSIPRVIMGLFRRHCFDAVLLDMPVLAAAGTDIVRMIRFRDEKLGIILLNCPGPLNLMHPVSAREIQAIPGPMDAAGLLAELDRMMIRKRLPAAGPGPAPALLTDDVTGLYTRVYFCERLLQEIRAMQREGGGFSVLFCAVSGLKRIYHDHGIAGGNAVLKQVAPVVREACRRCDTVARTRIDEISIILPTADIEGARTVAERIIRAASGISHSSMRDRPAAMAIGMSTYPVHAKISRDLLLRADRDLCRSRAVSSGMYTVYGDH